jgi:signal transduction histidine kinase
VLDWPIHRSLFAVGLGVAASLALGSGLVGITYHDIARQRMQERREAAAVLRDSEQQKALAVEAAELGTWQWEFNHDRITGCSRFKALLRFTDRIAHADWSSAEFLNAICVEDRSRVKDAVQRCLTGHESVEAEFRLAQQDSRQPRWLRIRGRAAQGGTSQSMAFGVIADVTSQKRSEIERLTLLRRLTQAQEDVQGRIARELHDQTGQTLTGLSLALKGFEQALAPRNGERDHSLRQRIRWMRQLVGEIGHQVHRVAADLRPTAIDDLGLTRALAAQLTDWSRQYRVAADFQIIGIEDAHLSHEIEIAVYRIIQEALTNVLKHAKADHISIIMERRGDDLRLVIEDDGIGFDENDIPMYSQSHLGISGMHERLALLNGTLSIESAPQHGTTLFVQIPLSNNQLG